MKFPICEILLAFKNGNTVVQKTIILNGGTKKKNIEMPSTAIHGTVWIACEETEIICTKSNSSEKDGDEETPCSSIGELIKANVGEEVIVNDEKESLKILEVLRKGVSGGIVVFATKAGEERFIPLDRISFIRGKEGKSLNRKILCKKQVREVEIHYKPPAKDATATMYYVMKMHLDTEKKMANLRMQATIMNDAENVFAKKFVCAAGNPRQKFKNVNDPFVSGDNIYSFFSAVAQAQSPIQAYGRAPQMQQQMNFVSNLAPPPALGGGGADMKEETTSSNATDYYYYDFSNISIEKSQRTTGPCTITSGKYHRISFNKNHLDKQLFAGQDQICFTAKTVDSLVEIADALSIRVKFEEDVNMTKTKKSFYGSGYVQAKVVNKVEIVNYQDKDISIVCDYRFVGEKESSSEKESKLTTELNNSVESSVITKIEWEIKLKKGKTKKFNFVYKKWVRDRNY